MRKAILLLALAAPAVQAQDFYYQSVMPNGRVVIGDRPEPGAKNVNKIPLRAGNTSAPLSPPAEPGADSREQALNDAVADVQSAQQALDAAKAALESGREPREGEVTGTVTGTRLNEAYAQRIQSLEDAVASAQKQLDEALARRNDAR